MSPLLIQDTDALADLCQRLQGHRWIALDTEFTRERTYYARLGLLQLATDDVIACVDPLAVDLTPLLDVLCDARLLKVLHAARQDLEVLHDLRKQVLAPVFDTQIAAALLGYPEQVGYATLVEAVTGVKLPKLHTRADWEKRPLGVEQLRYAEDDVRYLRDVYRKLEADLEQRGRLAWLTQECQALTDPRLYQNDPTLSYARMKPGHPLTPAGQARLKALAAWRERTAQVRDRPRGWVVADLSLIEIARRAPETLQDLERIPELTAKQIEAHGTDLIETARAAPPGDNNDVLWSDPRAPTATEQEQARAMLARIEACAKAEGLQPGVIGGKRAVYALLRENAGPLSHGWRWDLVGKELVVLLPDRARV
jgi:ribonuclease D